mmetsp:Transcript_7344/g.15110  ORF Transcript_7344/g.15110 Transcript_7344/m.15110 type:complete len:272 (+) Transcript_7344:1000-1815(+)
MRSKRGVVALQQRNAIARPRLVHHERMFFFSVRRPRASVPLRGVEPTNQPTAVTSNESFRFVPWFRPRNNRCARGSLRCCCFVPSLVSSRTSPSSGRSRESPPGNPDPPSLRLCRRRPTPRRPRGGRTCGSTRGFSDRHRFVHPRDARRTRAPKRPFRRSDGNRGRSGSIPCGSRLSSGGSRRPGKTRGTLPRVRCFLASAPALAPRSNPVVCSQPRRASLPPRGGIPGTGPRMAPGRSLFRPRRQHRSVSRTRSSSTGGARTKHRSGDRC